MQINFFLNKMTKILIFPHIFYKNHFAMKKYECTVCGYIYDPEKGDPDSGIAPGTPFEDLPDDWTCPECGVTKEDFEPLED